jgi:putative intracellular protease/amidase
MFRSPRQRHPRQRPHQNSGQGWESGIVVPDLALSQVNEDDYSAIVFVGGWGSSMYQSTAFPGDYFNDHYDGDVATKTLVNNLIGEFDAAEKYLGFICHATTIAAWSTRQWSQFDCRQTGFRSLYRITMSGALSSAINWESG